MKKALLTLSLLGLAGAAAFGVASFQNNPPLEVKAEATVTPGEDGYISVDDLGFTSTDPNYNGFISEAYRTYWNEGYSHFALGRFLSTGFSGGTQVNYDKESWTGTLTSKTWTQNTRYVYFQLGAARDVTDEERLVFHASGNSKKYDYDILNHTFCDGRMLLWYLEIPEQDFTNLGGENGFEMNLDIVDGRSGDWGLVNFGYLHVNQTKGKVGDAMRYYLNHLSQRVGTGAADVNEINARKTVQGHYYGNGDLRKVFYAEEADISESFDSQSDFINHWYFDHTYYNNENTNRNFDGVISTAAAHPGSMPYNKEGDGFFRGYLEGDGKGGFMSSDTSRYRFLSRPFVIDKDNPYVSIKMGGKASLHVIDAETNPGTNQAADLAWIDARGYSHGGTDGLVYTGYNVTTIKRHIINLQAFKGRTVQLAIADVGDGGGWQAANFDSLEVNINPASFKADTITQTKDDKTYYCVFPDVYVNSNSNWKQEGENQVIDDANGIHYTNLANVAADTTDVKAAADFLLNYYGVIRNTDNGTSFCGANKEILTSDPVKGIVDSYNELTEGAQKIVCASTDYQQGTYATKDTWFEQAVVSSNVGTTLEYIASYNNIKNTTIYGNLAFFGNNTTAISVTVFAGIAGIGAVIAFLLLKKRKEKAE